MTFGYLANIMSDNNYKFRSASVRDYAKKAGINWSYLSTYNLRGNPKVERMVRTIKRAVLKIVLKTNLE